jgi:hypothetical protein
MRRSGGGDAARWQWKAALGSFTTCERCSATAAEGGDGELHDMRALERGRELKSGVERCEVAEGWSSPFSRG